MEKIFLLVGLAPLLKIVWNDLLAG